VLDYLFGTGIVGSAVEHRYRYPKMLQLQFKLIVVQPAQQPSMALQHFKKSKPVITFQTAEHLKYQQMYGYGVMILQ
jgi:hypothetical protein